MRKRPKVLITGGHFTPALATIQKLNKSSVKIEFVTRQFADWHGSESLEKKLLKKLKIKTHLIDPPKLHRKPFIKNIHEIPKIYPAIKSINLLLEQSKPDLILSFGGYVALPVCILANQKNIKIVTHEQTPKLGLANQVISRISKKTAYSWPDHISPRSGSKYVLTGNPVRKQFARPQSRPNWIPKTQNLLITVTGGNQGSLLINQKIHQLTSTLTKKFTLVHQTGSARNNHDLLRANKLRARLPLNQQQHYLPKSWLSAKDLAWCFQNSSLVISRAGANTVTELLVTSAHSLLIPLKYSAGKEQQSNAQILKNTGLTTILPQDHIELLESKIMSSLNQKPPSNSHRKKLQALHLGAANKLSSLVLQCLSKH